MNREISKQEKEIFELIERIHNVDINNNEERMRLQRELYNKTLDTYICNVNIQTKPHEYGGMALKWAHINFSMVAGEHEYHINQGDCGIDTAKRRIAIGLEAAILYSVGKEGNYWVKKNPDGSVKLFADSKCQVEVKEKSS